MFTLGLDLIQTALTIQKTCHSFVDPAKTPFRIAKKILGFSIFIALTWIAPPINEASAQKNNSEVLYADEDIGFLLIEPLAGSLKNGDPVCVIKEKTGKSYCSGRIRVIERKKLIFMDQKVISLFEQEEKVLVKKVFVNKNKGFTALIAVEDQLQKEGRKKTHKKQSGSIASGALPVGGKVVANVDSPEISGNDFPEIYIPKIKKRRKKKTETDGNQREEIKKALRKIFRKNNSISYRFASTTDPVPVKNENKETQKEEPRTTQVNSGDFDYIYPNPISHVLDIELIQSLPLAPVSTFKSVKFETITGDNKSRTTLWKSSDQELKPIGGTGFVVNFTRHLTNIFSLGWRYHLFEKSQTKTKFDLSREDDAFTETRIHANATHGEWGKKWSLFDRLHYFGGMGLELYQSAVEFRSYSRLESSENDTLIAYADSEFKLLSLRIHNAFKLQWRSVGISAGAILTVPVHSFKKTFDGKVVIPEVVTFSGSTSEDLEGSLTHQESKYGAEVYLGLIYQPQR